MSYETPRLTENGQGMWADAPLSGSTTFGTPALGRENALETVGSTPQDEAGRATRGGANDLGGKDQGSGQPDKPSPNQSLLASSGNLAASPDQGTGKRDRPSPDQSILSTLGRANRDSARQPAFGGSERNVQI
jgi:hypothetical protein